MSRAWPSAPRRQLVGACRRRRSDGDDAGGSKARAISVFSLLHSARPVLLNFGQAGGFDIAPWAERVQHVDASYAGSWELPVVGVVPAPSAVCNTVHGI